tara:strand:+ start:967 stop:1407 length:441 start_codon:yes stop_codon:yes gene_type:complete
MDYPKAKMLADNLRAFAMFIEGYAEDIPDDITVELSTHLWSWSVEESAIPSIIGKAMKAAVLDGADIKKEYSDNYFRCYMTWGMEAPKVTWKIVSGREDVCTKKVLGTHKVTKMVAPEGDWTEQEVEEEIVEWECHSLLKMASDEA